MRRIAKQQEGDGAEIDLTPMLDVVFHPIQLAPYKHIVE